MKIKINGKETDISASSLAVLLNKRKLDPLKVVVEHNGKIADKKEFANTAINENDTIEIISFVGGG